MKKLLVVLACVGLFTACKKDDIDPYAFPSIIKVVNKNCLQSWESLEFEISNVGDKITRYDAKMWLGFNEKDIFLDPASARPILEANSKSSFFIQARDIGENNFIHVQLLGFSDKGALNIPSRIYKFRKETTNNCIKWVGYE